MIYSIPKYVFNWQILPNCWQHIYNAIIYLNIGIFPKPAPKGRTETIQLTFIHQNICRGSICRGPICWGPICRQKNFPGPNLPGLNLPQKIARGPICLEPSPILHLHLGKNKKPAASARSRRRPLIVGPLNTRSSGEKLPTPFIDFPL